MNPDFLKPLDQREVELASRVCDGSKEAAIFVYNIREICRIGKKLDYLKILFWLQKNRVTGRRFVEWVVIDHERDLVKAVADVRKRLHNDHKVRPIFARGTNG